MERTLAEMLMPQISESDITMVDLYGLKSKAADDIEEIKDNSIASVLSGTGGKNIFGQEVPPLTEEDLLGLVMGTTGGSMGSGKGLLKGLLKKGKNLFKKSNVADVSKLGKKTGDVLPSGKTFKIKSGGEARDVTTVAVRNADGSISHQPFYKSSGTSGKYGKGREGRWMPYLGQAGGGMFHKGRINLKGKQVSHMADPTKKYTEAQEFAGRMGGDPYNIHGGTKRMVGISDELKKLEKGFKQTGEGTLQGEIGKWIGKENLGDLFF